MVTLIVKILIVVLEVVLLLGINSFFRGNPTAIVGFKWGVTASEVAEDKRWLKKGHRAMKVNGWITLVGGVVAAFFTSNLIYIGMLIVPTLIFVIYLSLTQPRGGLRL